MSASSSVLSVDPVYRCFRYVIFIRTTKLAGYTRIGKHSPMPDIGKESRLASTYWLLGSPALSVKVVRISYLSPYCQSVTYTSGSLTFCRLSCLNIMSDAISIGKHGPSSTQHIGTHPPLLVVRRRQDGPMRQYQWVILPAKAPQTFDLIFSATGE